jgi:hypothetical protein
MLATLAAIVAQILDPGRERWLGWASLALAGCAIGIAAARTVPSAVRLGARRDGAVRQSELARSILRQHLFSFTAVAALLALQLGFG